MHIFKDLGRSAKKLVEKVEEKNKFAALVNRVRNIMRMEQKAAEREYVTLGRYYYQNERDKGNLVTEKHCAELDKIEGGLNRAMDELEKIYYEAAKLKKEEREEISLDDVQELDAPPEIIAEAGEPETAEPSEKTDE
jgi:hypothetical protein